MCDFSKIGFPRKIRKNKIRNWKVLGSYYYLQLRQTIIILRQIFSSSIVNVTFFKINEKLFTASAKILNNY